MVSSKCCQVVSPSPLRFLAALMPPCAHTECDRLTGTMENRSTCPPASAILMVAASPARPPPTTIILGAVAINQFGNRVTWNLANGKTRFSHCQFTYLLNYSLTNFFHLPRSTVCSIAGSFSGVFLHCGLKNADRVASPMAINPSATRAKALPAHLREF